jgi:hypothetical protein
MLSYKSVGAWAKEYEMDLERDHGKLWPRRWSIYYVKMGVLPASRLVYAQSDSLLNNRIVVTWYRHFPFCIDSVIMNDPRLCRINPHCFLGSAGRPLPLLRAQLRLMQSRNGILWSVFLPSLRDAGRHRVGGMPWSRTITICSIKKSCSFLIGHEVLFF